MKCFSRPLGPAVAIVLGGALNSDGSPSKRTVLRAEAAAELALRHPQMTIIATGDGRNAELRAKRSLTEAVHMKRIICKRGVSGKRILQEHEACDTIGNIILVATRFLKNQKPRPVYIVTSPFHGERALLMCRFVLGSDWPVEFYPSAVAEGDKLHALREAGGIAWAQEFFAPMTPGNIAQAEDRLRTVGKERYRAIRWLKQRQVA